MPLALLILLVAGAGASPGDEREEGVDPEVAACRQQCARQRQFGEAERRYCLRQCDEYGRAKRQQQEEERQGPERERDWCLHECRAGPPKPGCERRCREAYERGHPRRR
ncbi:hypothetical protein GQ55_3G206600 [Panicum hallii var. hallii]|uniref:Bifunctional inhibitor/plant lipid transfer protein/seed storage helical domain-containing protein n=1 Tax=Panicum hallii var. hallii TaxID=1504633 RepID=A0A2T7EBL4_9POAL|nr:hypothetical protein GQ55_3G206600 [Panicum hallii var. hallii]